MQEARRRGLDPEERQRVMEAVALRTPDGWRAHFTVMLTLSVVVAVMGLSADSAAIVIGAMLLAPLMVPVMGISAALAMALPQHLARSAAVVIVASVLSAFLAYLLAAAIPNGQLSSEVLARTSPDLRDLLVALAAGAAGAYATIRADVSSALPGVAVAVALVPPLGTIGLTLHAGRLDLARGAALLYLANLTAIVLISVLVFIITGFVPPRRLRETSRRVMAGTLVATIASVGVAIPLGVATVRAAEAGHDRAHVQQAITDWLAGTGDEIDDVRIQSDLVRVKVSGPNPPPETGDLERTVREILGNEVVLEVRWTHTEDPPATEPTVTIDPAISDAQARRTAVAAAIDAWLGETPDSYEVVSFTVEDDEIVIDITSEQSPPSVDLLARRLADGLGLQIPVAVNWTERATLRPDHEAELNASIQSDVTKAANRWANRQSGVEVSAVNFDGTTLDIEITGPSPGDTSDLYAAADAVLTGNSEIDPDAVTVHVWFTERSLVTATAPPISSPPTTVR